MKFWSVISLVIFLNFSALPSLAVVFGWELPTMNIVLQEEEHQDSTANLYEKAIPKSLCINDFISLKEFGLRKIKFTVANDNLHRNPFISIFSPPPERA